MDRLQHLGLLGAHGVGVEAGRRLHRGQRQKLEQVVRHHVAQRAGRVVELAAPLDADRLGDGDLHMVDVVAVPQRLEDAVGEAQHHDVLHRLLAEIMIDPIDLASRPARRGSARFSACAECKIGAERLLDDDPPPTVRPSLASEAGVAELLDDRARTADGGVAR